MCGRQASFMLRQYGLIAKAISQVITVIATDDAVAGSLNTAVELKAKAMGFGIGEQDDNKPRALFQMATKAAKWSEIYPEDYYKLDGVVIYAEGEAVIVTFK